MVALLRAVGIEPTTLAFLDGAPAFPERLSNYCSLPWRPTRLFDDLGLWLPAFYHVPSLDLGAEH